MHSCPDRVELVISRQLFDQRTTTIVIKHDKVAEKSQEAFGLANSLQQHLQRRLTRIR